MTKFRGFTCTSFRARIFSKLKFGEKTRFRHCCKRFSVQYLSVTLFVLFVPKGFKKNFQFLVFYDINQSLSFFQNRYMRFAVVKVIVVSCNSKNFFLKKNFVFISLIAVIDSDKTIFHQILILKKF